MLLRRKSFAHPNLNEGGLDNPFQTPLWPRLKMRFQDATALLNFVRQAISRDQAYKILLKELKKVLQVMPIEDKPHTALVG